jgi:hypothetical protein
MAEPEIAMPQQFSDVRDHFSTAGRVWPKDPAEDPGHAPFFAMVKKIGFHGGLSIEGRVKFEADAAVRVSAPRR